MFMAEFTGTTLSVFVAIAAVLVCLVTVLVGILTLISAYIVYIHWKTGKEYEEDIRKKREEVKREFDDFIRLSPKFGKISSRLSLSLQYSQWIRTTAEEDLVDKFAPFVREALNVVFGAIHEVEYFKLKYGKEEFNEFRSEAQDIKLNLEIANRNFPGRVHDVIDKCKDIIDCIDRLSFDQIFKSKGVEQVKSRTKNSRLEN